MRLSRPSVGLRLTVVSILLAATAGSAAGQVFRDRDEEKKEREERQKRQQAPATPPPPPPPTEPLAPQVLRHERGNRWQATVTMSLRGSRERTVGADGSVIETRGSIELNSAALVFPLLARSATSQIGLAAGGREERSGLVRWGGREVESRFTLQDNLPAGTRLGRWEVRNVAGMDASLEVRWEVESFNTVLDEAVAVTLPWPARWPAAAQSALAPALFIESDSAEVRDMMKQITNGVDPRTIPPVHVAKAIAGAVMERFVPTGEGLLANGDGTAMGFELRGAKAMTADGRGSQHDLACLLTAVYRAAGLPARVVVGIDNGRSDGLSGARGGRGSGLRSWVEFALVDPFNGKEFWVPVDIHRMRRGGTRAPAFDRSWPFFGTHSELADVVPLAFQYHPPAPVSARAPMFWGWVTNPPLTQVDQSIRWNVIRAPRTNNARAEWRRD
jgi:hypothetical protein